MPKGSMNSLVCRNPFGGEFLRSKELLEGVGFYINLSKTLSSELLTHNEKSIHSGY
jgi:hypothetical protein